MSDMDLVIFEGEQEKVPDGKYFCLDSKCEQYLDGIDSRYTIYKRTKSDDFGGGDSKCYMDDVVAYCFDSDVAEKIIKALNN